VLLVGKSKSRIGAAAVGDEPSGGANPPYIPSLVDSGSLILVRIFLYPNAVTLAFQTDVDYAVLTKKYVGDSNLPDAAHRYSPGHVAGIETTVIRGRPDRDRISTSYVERCRTSLDAHRCSAASSRCQFSADSTIDTFGFKLLTKDSARCVAKCDGR
jgi:hypothetical protein